VTKVGGCTDSAPDHQRNRGRNVEPSLERIGVTLPSQANRVFRHLL